MASLKTRVEQDTLPRRGRTGPAGAAGGGRRCPGAARGERAGATSRPPGRAGRPACAGGADRSIYAARAAGAGRRASRASGAPDRERAGCASHAPAGGKRVGHRSRASCRSGDRPFTSALDDSRPRPAYARGARRPARRVTKRATPLRGLQTGEGPTASRGCGKIARGRDPAGTAGPAGTAPPAAASPAWPVARQR